MTETETPRRSKLPGKHFDQIKEDGNLSPLRGSIAWDTIHN